MRLVSAALGVLVGCGASAAPLCPEPVAPPPDPATAGPQAGAEPAEPEPWAIRGECNLAGVPESMRQTLTDEESDALIARMHEWLESDWHGFAIPEQTGMLFAKSEDDIGADPPYPRSFLAQGVHACSLEGEWLLAGIKQAFRRHGAPESRNAPIACAHNVCCYTALGEYDSAGGIVFARSPNGWQVRAAYQAADNGTLMQETIDGSYRVVRGHLERLAEETCAGEPAP